RLDVVPRVCVAAREPGDHPRGELPLGDGVDGLLQLAGGGDAGHVGEGHGAGASSAVVSGLRAYTTRLLPIRGVRTRSAARVSVDHGRAPPMSQQRTSW